VSTFDVFHLGGLPILRLVSRLGKPLSEAERRTLSRR